jgi:hypothetical protein
MFSYGSNWRGGRVVEGAALEMLFGGNANEGSNPSLSVFSVPDASLLGECRAYGWIG